MVLVKNFSDFTNTPWDVVWDKSIIEVLNVMAFAREYNRKQEEAIKRYRRTH